MQIKLFTIPASDTEDYAEELNRFLRTNKILQVESNFVNNGNNAVWYFCVRYLPSSITEKKQNVSERKTDYREILDEATFAVFSKLRECRKQIANEEALPAYAVFTDAELANIAALKPISEKNLALIKGIGGKKMERYGKRFVELYIDALQISKSKDD